MLSAFNIIVIYHLDKDDKCHVVLDQLPEGAIFNPRHVSQGYYITNTTNEFYSRDAKFYARISKQEWEAKFGKIEYP